MASLPTYNATKVAVLSLSPSQAGYVEVSGPEPWVWVESSLPVSLTRFREPGFSFDFSISHDGERGLALAPRLPFTAVTRDLAGTGETSSVWTLTFVTSLTSKSPAPNVYMVRSPSPWSGSTNTPFTNRMNSGDESILIEDLTSASASWVLNPNGSTYDLVYEFDFLTTADNYLGSASFFPLSSSIRPFFDLINSSTWNGLVQFHLDAESAISMSVSSVVFSGNVHDWHTGVFGLPLRDRGRATHCYITGEPYFSTTAVQDGYRDNVLVHSDNYDPADSLDTDFFTPPPGEGVVDDEITDVE